MYSMPILLFAASMQAQSNAVACPVSAYGRVGDQFALVRAAVSQINRDFGGLMHENHGFVESDFHLVPSNVIVVERMDRFLDCHGIRDSAVRSALKAEREALVIGHRLPIYLNGELANVSDALRLFASTPHLSYSLAHILGHEWTHIILAADDDVEPYEIEVLLLAQWIGCHPKLAVPLQPELASARVRLKQSKDEVAAGSTSTFFTSTGPYPREHPEQHASSERKLSNAPAQSPVPVRNRRTAKSCQGQPNRKESAR